MNPISFNADMVRAILDGRQTQMRLPVGVQPPGAFQIPRVYKDGTLTFHAESEGDSTIWGYRQKFLYVDDSCVGGQFWVREKWATSQALDHVKPSNLNTGFPCAYAAGGTSVFGYDQLVNRGKWRSSVHMPWHAARLIIEITALRVERLQSIDAEGALAEGRKHLWDFIQKWDGTYGDGAFCLGNNPWVWVIEFKRKDIKR